LMLFEYVSSLRKESSMFSYLLIHHVSKSNQQ